MHPVLCSFGSLTIYSYGVFVALAVLVSWIYARALSSKLRVSSPLAADILFILFTSGILGARIFYVAQRWADYSSQPWRAFALQEGGLVWYGGFFGALLAGYFFLHWKHEPKIFWADFFACIVPLAHGIGRLGCFFNGCCYGKYLGQATRHPVQLYEVVLLGLLAAATYQQMTRAYRPGRVVTTYFIPIEY